VSGKRDSPNERVAGQHAVLLPHYGNLSNSSGMVNFIPPVEGVQLVELGWVQAVLYGRLHLVGGSVGGNKFRGVTVEVEVETAIQILSGRDVGCDGLHLVLNWSNRVDSFQVDSAPSEARRIFNEARAKRKNCVG